VLAGRGFASWGDVVPYIIVQCLGGVAGTALAHLMFDLAPFAVGTTVASGASQWLAEAVATFTLILTIFGGIRFAPQAIPWLVGLTSPPPIGSPRRPPLPIRRDAGARVHRHVRRDRHQSRAGIRVAQIVGAVVAALAGALLFPVAKATARPRASLRKRWRISNVNFFASYL